MKKPTIKELTDQLTKAETALGELRHKLALAEAEASGLRKSTAEHEATAKAAVEQLEVAKYALRPFGEKTEKWQWPDNHVVAVMPLTFGDLREAREAALKLCP